MLLFRYFGSYALETLQSNLLKTATISSLNDPFEVLYRLAGTMTFTKAKRYLKRRTKTQDFFTAAQFHNPEIRSRKDLKKFMAVERDTIAKNLVKGFPELNAQVLIEREASADRILRVVCFSESTVGCLEEILIWSHYANKHRGVRVGFEFPEGIEAPFKIIPIQYQQERVAIDLTEGVEIDRVKTAINASIRVKSLAWKYECEHRMITTKEFCLPKKLPNGERGDFLPFQREWVKHVDVGVRSSPQEIKAMKEFLGKEYPNVQLRQADFHPTDYALDYKAA